MLRQQKVGAVDVLLPGELVADVVEHADSGFAPAMSLR
jgi:hypothetical protein